MQVTLHISNSQDWQILLPLLERLNIRFEQNGIEEHTPTKTEFMNNLRLSVAEMQAYERGEMELPTWEDMMAELEN